MGYLLEGPAILAEKTEMVSDPVPLGGLQALPSGQLVLLMADHQSVGGYPKIAVVISADIPKAAQLRIGDRVRFLPVRLEVAHQLLKLQESCIGNGVQT
jgi:antagonist of KipI